MRKTLTAVALTTTLFGGLAATAPAASAAPVVVAQDGEQAGQGDDKTGLWGLLGLLGLAGLAKRKVKDDSHSGSARR